jgi:hypothetical protein
MIGFLLGALNVLEGKGARVAERISPEHLKSACDVPPIVLEHCVRVVEKTRGIMREIQGHRSNLAVLKNALDHRLLDAPTVERQVRGFVRAYHDLRRRLDEIEDFFAGHLTRFNSDDARLTLISAALWHESGLPASPPVVVASSSNYFLSVAPLEIIFAPPSGADDILVLPDLYHEFGHILHQLGRINLFGRRFERALAAYEEELLAQRRRHYRPLDPDLIEQISRLWALHWAEEVACDTLAALVLGPSYGWCNLLLCLRHPEIYLITDHPADAARTQHIFRVLKHSGWVEEAEGMQKRWEQYARSIQHPRGINYHDYHTDQLFVAVMEDVEEAAKGLATVSTAQDTICGVLNEAWTEFLVDPANFIRWKERAVIRLAEMSDDAI